MEPNTHLGINSALCGEVIELTDGGATAQLTTTAAMAADDQGLVHGGFVFGLADYAAMLAVNDPNSSPQHVSNLYLSDPNLRPDGVLVFGAQQHSRLFHDFRVGCSQRGNIGRKQKRNGKEECTDHDHSGRRLIMFHFQLQIVFL